MKRTVLTLVAAAAAVAMSLAAPVLAQKVVHPKGGAPGQWRLLGTTHANHTADHDAIVVQGPYDNFRKLKFKVTDAPLNMQHMVVTYDNGDPTGSTFARTSPRAGRAGSSTSKASENAAFAGSSSGTTRRGS